MIYVPVITQHDQYLDADNIPLAAGKLEVRSPISNNLVDIYTYGGVPATNPIILNGNGRPTTTYFVTQLAYIRIYKYLGEFTSPLQTDDSANWEFVREYLVGQDETADNRETAHGMNELRDMDPSVGIVNVVGYYTDNDCPLRTYAWDELCTLEDDGGYVIGSNSTSTGRWTLIFDQPYIPSDYYGVYPGHLSNLHNLLGFVDEVSGRKTAQGIYFVPGHYETTTTMATTKKILVNTNTQIDTALQCTAADVIGKPTAWIGDLMATEGTVHSSWFKTAENFWRTAAKTKICDGHTWTDNVLKANVSNTGVTFVATGGAALTTDTDTNDTRITLSNCVMVGDYGFLYRDMHVRFQGMPFTDKYYTNAAIYPHKIEFNNLLPVTMDADDFKDIVNYANTAYMAGIADADFKGHKTATTLNLTEYRTVRNLLANTITMGKATGSIQYVIKDCEVEYVGFEGTLLTVDGTDMRLTSFANLGTLNVINGSKMSSGWTLTRGAVNCENSSWYMNINMAADNVTKGSDINFRNSIVGHCTLMSKRLHFYGCQLDTVTAKVYPYKEDDKYRLFLRLERCNIDNNDGPTVQFTLVPDNACTNCWWNVRMVGNDFQGDSKGVTCPFWANTSWRTMFIARGTDEDGQNNNFYVIGNTGNCPHGGDARLTLTSPNDYEYNWNRDPYISYYEPVHVGGSLFRIWACYNKYGYAMPERFMGRPEMRTHGSITYPRDGQENPPSNVYQFDDMELHNWRIYLCANAPFAVNVLDPAYEGTRDVDELNDYFAARVMQATSTKNLLYQTY